MSLEDADAAYEVVRNSYRQFRTVRCDLLALRVVTGLRALFSLYVLASSRPSPIRRLMVAIDRSPSGMAIRCHLGGQRYLPEICRAMTVLRLPGDYDTYLRSRHRQALRTNLRRASEHNIVCRAIDKIVFQNIVSDLVRAGSDISYVDALHGYSNTGATDFWTCSTANGEVIGLALLAVAGQTAHLAYLCCSHKSNAYRARWALFASIVKTLISRGVELVIADKVINVSSGNAYFQQRLGFSTALVIVAESKPALAEDDCLFGRWPDKIVKRIWPELLWS